MKLNRKTYLFVFVGIILLAIIAVFWYNSHSKEKINEDTINFPEENERWESYFKDSTYKVVVDSMITIYEVKTGKKLNSFGKPIGYRSMEMHPSGSHLAVLDEYQLYLHKVNENDTLTPPEDYTPIDEYDKDCVEFSSDGKYLLLTDYAEVQICIYSWPELKFLDSGKCGFYRNNFWWKEKAGSLIFYYEDIIHFKESKAKKFTYRMFFPVKPHKLRFSEPVCIDSCEIKEE
ncbi:MAG: hypothetical protein ACOYOT_07180 [Bacteroidales bacterium]